MTDDPDASQAVELPIRVPQAEHESRLGPIAGHAHDDAVCRADLLDLDLFALPGDVATLCTFATTPSRPGLLRIVKSNQWLAIWAWVAKHRTV